MKRFHRTWRVGFNFSYLVQRKRRDNALNGSGHKAIVTLLAQQLRQLGTFAAIRPRLIAREQLSRRTLTTLTDCLQLATHD